MFITTNPIRSAIDRVGGPTKASNLLNVSNGAIHAWIKARRVTNIDLAKKLATLAGMDLQTLRPTK
jgi:DNA-binding transcriptional regulator YdaS (Cro superfamily)